VPQRGEPDVRDERIGFLRVKIAVKPVIGGHVDFGRREKSVRDESQEKIPKLQVVLNDCFSVLPRTITDAMPQDVCSLVVDEQEERPASDDIERRDGTFGRVPSGTDPGLPGACRASRRQRTAQ
jgi:hypothetical protein